MIKNYLPLAIFALAMSIPISSVSAQGTVPTTAVPGALVPTPIFLWPGMAPGEKGDIGEERDTTPPDAKTPPDQYVMRIGNVTKPTITVFPAPHEKDTGTAIVVCPGGGYNILAYNKEGTEVCAWLNSIGVTGVLLKYRVPGRGDERYTAPLQDAQRALGLVRSHAREWGIIPDHIGIMGFSAGGHLSAALSTNYESRTYPVVDDADKTSCRPDFTMLIYPAYLNGSVIGTLAPEIKVDEHTPPAFLVQAQDDKAYVESSYVYGLALKRAGISAELHIYPTGGHGYGLRPSPNEVSHWPQLAEKWLASQGMLKPKPQNP